MHTTGGVMVIFEISNCSVCNKENIKCVVFYDDFYGTSKSYYKDCISNEIEEAD